MRHGSGPRCALAAQHAVSTTSPSLRQCARTRMVATCERLLLLDRRCEDDGGLHNWRAARLELVLLLPEAVIVGDDGA